LAQPERRGVKKKGGTPFGSVVKGRGTLKSERKREKEGHYGA